MTINPRSFKGENTALLAPITTLNDPLHISFQVQERCAWVSLECQRAMLSPKTARNRPAIWGVREISGSRIIAVRL